MSTTKAKRVRPRMFRHWMATMQNPGPAVDFVQWMLTLNDDITKITWAYEMGAKDVGVDNPAYVEGEKTGGNLHYQVFFSTRSEDRAREQAMQTKMRFVETDDADMQIGWLEGAYAPTYAEKYCVKQDHTLVSGPWSWGTDSTPGARNDLKKFRDLIKQCAEKGEDYDSLLTNDEAAPGMAKYYEYGRRCWQKFYNDANPAIEFKELRPWQQKVVDLLDEAVKPRRVIWIWSKESDTGKSTFAESIRGKYKILNIQSGKEWDVMQAYSNHKVIWFDWTREGGWLNKDLLHMVENFSNIGMKLSTKHHVIQKFIKAHIVVTSNKNPEVFEKMMPNRIVSINAGKDNNSTDLDNYSYEPSSSSSKNCIDVEEN